MPALFLSLFAVQAAIMSLPLVITQVASDLGVSTAAAGQLRTVVGLVAGVASLALAGSGARLRVLLGAGLALLAAGCVASAAAPSFAALCAAQVLVGVAVAMPLGGAGAAALQWAPEELRSRALARSMLGQPAAWVVGMPLGGVLGQADWRLSLVVPFVAAAVAMVVLARTAPADDGPRAVASAGSARVVLRDRPLALWMAAEVLSYAAWGAVLLFSAALLVEVYSASVSGAAVILAAGAVAYMPGNVLVRRRLETHARVLAVIFSSVMAGLAAVFFAVPMSLGAAGVLFAALCFAGGGRTLAGTAAGLHVAPDLRLAVMSVRAATMHFGFLLGSAAGGVALAAGGYPGLGLTVALLCGASIAPHLPALAGGRLPRPMPAAAASGSPA